MRIFLKGAKDIRLALNHNRVMSSLSRELAENQQMRDLEGLEWGAYLTIMYCDLRLVSNTSNNVVKLTCDLSICLRNNRSKASNWPTLKACPLVKEYKYVMIS